MNGLKVMWNRLLGGGGVEEEGGGKWGRERVTKLFTLLIRVKENWIRFLHMPFSLRLISWGTDLYLCSWHLHLLLINEPVPRIT